MSLPVNDGLVRDKAKFRDRFSGVCIGIPLFAELTGTGLSLPQSHFEMAGIAVHSSMIAFILLLADLKVRKKILLYALVFIIYLLLSMLQDFSRALFALQSIYFFAFYFILQSLDLSRVRLIGLWAILALLLFGAAHIVSIGISFFTSFYGGLTGAANFWGLIIYQSHLTYPLVLVFGLWMSHFYPSELGRYSVIFLAVVLILEVMLFRRSALSVLVVYLLAYRPKIMLLTVIPAILMIGIYASDLIAMVSERFTFTRSNAWQNSFDIFSDWVYLLFGNGLNNYSHNFFLHTLTTHGLVYSAIIYSIIAGIVLKFIRETNYSLRPCLIVLAIIMIDWNVNVNLYQPYYAAMFALALVIVGNDHSQKTKNISCRSKNKASRLM